MINSVNVKNNRYVVYVFLRFAICNLLLLLFFTLTLFIIDSRIRILLTLCIIILSSNPNPIPTTAPRERGAFFPLIDKDNINKMIHFCSRFPIKSMYIKSQIVLFFFPSRGEGLGACFTADFNLIGNMCSKL